MKMTRILAILLTIVLAASMASPLASAMSADEKASLVTGQRSIAEPDGAFDIPAIEPKLRLIHPYTRNGTGLLLWELLMRIVEGKENADDAQLILSMIPLVKQDDPLPPIGQWNSLFPFLVTQGFWNIYLMLRETDDPDVYQFIALYSNLRGSQMRYNPMNMFYDKATGWIYGGDEKGLFSLGNDYNINFYIKNTTYAIPRYTGYSILADILLAPMVGFFLDTVRFPFEYDGKPWQIQIWKGRYMVANGGEIGLYELTSPIPYPLHMLPSNTYLDLRFEIYHGENQEIFMDYGPKNTWWVGAYRIGNFSKTPILPAKELRMAGSITFEDQAMCDAFFASFLKNKPDNMTGSLKDLIFTFDWKAG